MPAPCTALSRRMIELSSGTRPRRRHGPPDRFIPAVGANPVVAVLHLRGRGCAGDALPFATRHLHPGVHPAFMGINRFAIAAGAFASPGPGSDRRVPKRGYLYIADLIDFPFTSLGLGQ